MHRVSPLLLTHTFTSFGYWIFGVSANTESCKEDDEEVGVGVVEELADHEFLNFQR